MYETLTAQHLQWGALDAAAKADLPEEAYSIFVAVTSVAEATQTPRNHLAHWAWGGCHQKPEFLALVEPKKLKENNLRQVRIETELAKGRILDIDGYFQEWIDPSDALGYSEDDLSRALRDLSEAYECLGLLATYLGTIPFDWREHAALETRQIERDQALAQLNDRRLFREALARRCAVRKSNPQGQGG